MILYALLFGPSLGSIDGEIKSPPGGADEPALLDIDVTPQHMPKRLGVVVVTPGSTTISMQTPQLRFAICVKGFLHFPTLPDGLQALKPRRAVLIVAILKGGGGVFFAA